MNLFKIIKYHLYLLQLENYELGRYWKLLFAKGLWPKGKQRKNLIWTAKALVVFALAEALALAVAGIFSWIIYREILENTAAAAVVFLAITTLAQLLSFVFLSLAVALLVPVDWAAKQMIINRAKSRILKINPEIKIIGIAGSYGKTSMKEVLLSVLGEKFNVAATPESVNTPLGIARWALEKFDETLDVAIVEMGEHYRGDIAALCKITPVDIAVVTGINEAHLERLKNLDNAIATVFEIAEGTRPQGTVVINGDDKNVMENYKKFVWPDHKVLTYSVAKASSKNFNQDRLVWESELEGVGRVEVGMLGEYGLADAAAAAAVAKTLGMDNEEIKEGIKKVRPVQHRLQPIQSGGNVLVIDDSYNGNPDGVKEAVKVLGRFGGRRKVYITPGLVEMGKRAREIHEEIGEQLSKVADLVVLVRNSVTPHIAEGLEKNNFSKENIKWYGTAQQAHAALPELLKAGDVVMFQNDWGDQYI